MSDNEVMSAYAEVPNAYSQGDYINNMMKSEEPEAASSGIKFEKYETVISNPDKSTVTIKKNSFKVPYWVIAVLALTIVFPFILHYGTKISAESVKGAPLAKLISWVSGDRAKASEKVTQSDYVVEPATLLPGVSEESKSYKLGCEYLREGEYEKAAAIFLSFPKTYNVSNALFDIQTSFDYGFYDPAKDEIVNPARADQYWAVHDVKEATCHLVYMYDTLDSEDFSFFYVHDTEPGVADTNAKWYAFDGRGMLLYIDR